MKKKIIGIIIVMLLIGTVLPTMGIGKESNADDRQSVSVEFVTTVEHELDLVINPSDPIKTSSLYDPYEVYEGQHLEITITGYWEPPNPTKTICLWVDVATLPAGATFTPECHCAPGQVSSIFEWTPSIGQAGTYVVIFYLGEACGVPLGTFSITIIVHPADQEIPNVDISYPEDGSTFSVPDMTLTGLITDDTGIVELGSHHEWTGDETTISSTIDPPATYYPFEWDFTLHDGWNRITIYVYDGSGKYGEDSVILYLTEEDDIPPTTTKTVGEPQYGDEGYWVTGSTPFTLIAEDNQGGSGVYGIYYRVGDDNGMGAWMTYTTPFQISGTSGNCKYYIEYYAVDNVGNEENVHHQEHIVDNALPLTILDIDGLCLYDTDYIYISDNSYIGFCADDTCCRKIDWISIDFEDFYTKMIPKKDQEDKKSAKYPYKKIVVTIVNENGNWDGIWKKSEGEAALIDIPDKDETCTVNITIQGTFKSEDSMAITDLPIWGKTTIKVNCEWLKKQAEKGGQCFKNRVEGDEGNIHYTIDYGNFKVSFSCKKCPVQNSGLDVTQYDMAQYDILPVVTDNKEISKTLYSEWITYTGPFTIPEEGLYNIQYRSIDNLGQMEPVKTTAIIVDNTAPITPELLLPVDNAMTNATPFFDWEENEEDLSGILYILQISSNQSFNDVVLEAEIHYVSQYSVDIEDRLLSGEYYWRLKASDFVGNADDWSETRSFTVKDSNAPNKPVTPSGPRRGEPDKDYIYSSSTIDPDGDEVYYNFSWGDETYSGWIGVYNSDETASVSHNWTEKGSYEIKVKAMDEYGKESQWSDPLEVSMPKTKSFITINPWIFRLIQRFPILEFLI